MRCSRRWTIRRRKGANFRGGLTLIEVVASLALMGSLLVGIVLARGRYLHQWRLAQRKLEAVAAADELLRGWSKDWAQMPRDGQATINEKLMWRIERISHDELQTWNAQLVRLSLFDVTDTTAAQPLTHVDVVLPMPEPMDLQMPVTQGTSP